MKKFKRILWVLFAVLIGLMIGYFIYTGTQV